MERYSEDINSCTISEMLQMHNNMVGRAIFIQHEKDKLNFTWENFSSSDFFGLTSNKDIGIIIMPLNGNSFLFEGITKVMMFHILISVLLHVFMAF